jgi:2-hydroxy-4-carboxymuconate semialdehyde hemiacetal dehydrogenase
MLNPSNPQVNLTHGPIWNNGLPMEMVGTITSDDLRYASISLSYHSRHPRNELLVITQDFTYEIVNGVLSENGKVISANPEGEQFLGAGVMNQDQAFLAALDSGDYSQIYTFEKAHNLMSYIDMGYPKKL